MEFDMLRFSGTILLTVQEGKPESPRWKRAKAHPMEGSVLEEIGIDTQGYMEQGRVAQSQLLVPTRSVVVRRRDLPYQRAQLLPLL